MEEEDPTEPSGVWADADPGPRALDDSVHDPESSEEEEVVEVEPQGVWAEPASAPSASAASSAGYSGPGTYVEQAFAPAGHGKRPRWK